jgi:hypothetical protein
MSCSRNEESKVEEDSQGNEGTPPAFETMGLSNSLAILHQHNRVASASIKSRNSRIALAHLGPRGFFVSL